MMFILLILSLVSLSCEYTKLSKYSSVSAKPNEQVY